MPLLFVAQKQTESMAEHGSTGWIPLAAMNRIASVLDMPPMRVYEVATFYTMYNRSPIGKHNIQVCTTSPCMVCGAYDIVTAVKNHLGVEVGGKCFMFFNLSSSRSEHTVVAETTKDGLFHLMEAECLGACVNAPMMQIAGPICNDAYYEDLTAESAIAIIEQLRKGQAPKPGSQIGRLGSRGKAKTSLTSPPNAPFCRDLNAK
jgi:NADH:ubiquinone oxidoreductase subunit E